MAIVYCSLSGNLVIRAIVASSRLLAAQIMRMNSPRLSEVLPGYGRVPQFYAGEIPCGGSQRRAGVRCSIREAGNLWRPIDSVENFAHNYLPLPPCSSSIHTSPHILTIPRPVARYRLMLSVPTTMSPVGKSGPRITAQSSSTEICGSSTISQLASISSPGLRG